MESSAICFGRIRAAQHERVHRRATHDAIGAAEERSSLQRARQKIEEVKAGLRDEIVESKDGMGAAVPNVFAHRGDGSKMSRQMLGKTPQTESMAFTIPPGFSNDHENSHKGDQLIYVIEGKATCRVSGKECEIKAGDFVTIPAGAPHTLRTGAEKLFAVTVFAPPEA
jgi:quercetin dioxygenase-like cupin family protein